MRAMRIHCKATNMPDKCVNVNSTTHTLGWVHDTGSCVCGIVGTIIVGTSVGDKVCSIIVGDLVGDEIGANIVGDLVGENVGLSMMVKVTAKGIPAGPRADWLKNGVALIVC
jgi:hypothetical protein